eukprot:359540-Chlamydomonas_euryale.AAC.3
MPSEPAAYPMGNRPAEQLELIADPRIGPWPQPKLLARSPFSRLPCCFLLREQAATFRHATHAEWVGCLVSGGLVSGDTLLALRESASI